MSHMIAVAFREIDAADTVLGRLGSLEADHLVELEDACVAQRDRGGRPRAFYDFWERELRSQGYGLHASILDFTGGVPGNAGLTLSWANDPRLR